MKPLYEIKHLITGKPMIYDRMTSHQAYLRNRKYESQRLPYRWEESPIKESPDESSDEA